MCKVSSDKDGGEASGSSGADGGKCTEAGAKHRSSRRAASAAVSICAVLAAQSASPQALAQQQLPGIVVEGATLAAKPRRPTAPTAPTSGSQQPARPAQSAQSAEASPATGGTGGDGGQAGGTGEPFIATPSANVGSAVTIVTGAQLRAQQVRHAADALRSLPGVAVSRTGSFAGMTQVRIRGAEGNHTLVLIDGIEANSANNGEFDFANLSAEDIERIEVIRGPQSGIYGSSAVGGVVNIITRGGRGPLTITTRAEAGSFNTRDGSLRVSAGNDKAYFAGSLQGRKTRGFDIAPHGAENDGSQLSSGSLRMGAQIARDIDIDVTLRRQSTRGMRDTDGGTTVGRLIEQVDSPTTFTNADTMLGARLAWSTLGGGLVHELRTSKTSNVITDDDPTFKARNESETLRHSYKGTVTLATPGAERIKHTLTGQVEQRTDSFVPLSDFADGIERDRSQWSLTGEWSGAFYDRLFVSAHLRRDDNDSFPDFTTWRAAASLALREIGLRPHASIGTAAKSPTMYELYGSIPRFFTPNPGLEPEHSEGWDAGVELSLWQRRAVIDVTYFRADLTDKIDGFAPGPGGTFTARNLPGHSRREGVETEARVLLLPGLTLTAAHTHLEARNPDGLREVRRPQHAARADLSWLFDRERARLSLGVGYNGAMDDNVRRITGVNCFPGFGCFTITRPERYTLGDYTLVSLAGAYKLTDRLELFGRVENLLDTRYQEVYGFETAPVAAYAGFKLTFEDSSTASWAKHR